MKKWLMKLFKPIEIKVCRHENVGWCWLAQRVEYRECLDCGYGECRNPTTGEFKVLKKLKSDKNVQECDATMFNSSNQS